MAWKKTSRLNSDKDKDGRHRKETKEERRIRWKRQQKSREDCMKLVPTAFGGLLVFLVLFGFYVKSVPPKEPDSTLSGNTTVHQNPAIPTHPEPSKPFEPLQSPARVTEQEKPKVDELAIPEILADDLAEMTSLLDYFDDDLSNLPEPSTSSETYASTTNDRYARKSGNDRSEYQSVVIEPNPERLEETGASFQKSPAVNRASFQSVTIQRTDQGGIHTES